jgi:cystathionine beta-lyase/cystathionine gamma-synthase
MTDQRPDQRPGEHPETLAITAGRAHAGKALAPPIWASSTFEVDSVAAGRKLATQPKAAAFYSRYGNPTVNAFEDAVAALEGAEAAQAFGSGMGAVATTVLGLCSAGDHVVAQRQLFSSTALLFQMVCPRLGIEVTLVDAEDTQGFVDAVQPGRTRLVFVETPANPVLQLVDLDVIGSITGPFTVCDSTFAGPLITRPLEHGIDLVLHSATKALAGHNNATLGVVAGEKDLVWAIWGYHTIHGAVASPYDAANALTGLKTLGVRVRQQSESAQRIAEFLEGHPGVTRVNYPGLDSHPQRDLAKRQMALGGGSLSFDVAGGGAAGERFVEACRLARMAPSLGGPETLVTHPASTTAANLPEEERAAMGIGDGLIRMSVGLEHPDDLLADLTQALAASA